LKPNLAANWNTANMNIALLGQGDIRRFDDKRWDCQTYSVEGSQQYQRRLNVYSIAANYSQSCSSSDQLSDTGVIRPNNESETYSLSPSWSWQWSLLDQFSLRLNYSTTIFSSSGINNEGETSADAGFKGNETYSLNLSERHSWTRRLNSTASMNVSSSEFGSSNSSTSKQKTFGFQLSTGYNITRLWTANIGGGLSWVQSPSRSNDIADSSDSLLRTEVFNFSLNYSGRRMNYGLDYSRTNSPSASGQISENNTFNMNYSFEMSRKWSVNIDGSMLKNESIGQGDFSLSSERTYYTASVGVIWDFDKEWRLSANYQYRRQEIIRSGEIVEDGQSGVRDSNVLTIQLNYNWDGLRVFH